jgi:sulfoxide reductase heme-binding subunit YedZ
MASGWQARARLKLPLWLLAPAPFGWYAWQVANQARGLPDRLGPDPGDALTDVFGLWALRLLLLTLAVTPLSRLLGAPGVVTLRRPLGLFAFFYAMLHVTTYVLFLAGDLQGVLGDLAERPYIIAGAVALLSMLPLAVTSTRGWQRRLGRRWKRLHRLVHVCAVAALVHLLWQVRSDYGEFLLHALAFALLVALRVPPATGWRLRRPRPVPAPPRTPPASTTR